ncbi:MAG: hypothetical protein OEX12_12515 [Gammaproteobacteria bacterium]|nr:hypothetical protein [Gammaproteobacteria bacterium]
MAVKRTNKAKPLKGVIVPLDILSTLSVGQVFNFGKLLPGLSESKMYWKVTTTTNDKVCATAYYKEIRLGAYTFSLEQAVGGLVTGIMESV